MKRSILAILLVLVLCSVAAFASAKGEKAAGKPKITIFTLDSFKKIMDGTREGGAGLNQLEGLDEKMDVEWRLAPFKGFELKSEQAIAAPKPDVDLIIYLDRFASPAVFEKLESLDSYHKESPIDKMDDIFPGLRKSFTYKGELKGIPFRSVTYVMFYNKALYKERTGSEAPPKTIEEFWANVKKTTYKRSDGAQVYGLATYGGSDGRLFVIMAKAYGAKILSPDYKVTVKNPEMVQFVNDLRKAYEDGSIPPNLETLGEGDLQNLMCEGLGAHMIQGGDVFIQTLSNPERCNAHEGMTFAPYPAWSKLNEDFATHFAPCWAFVIPKNIPEDRKKAAWEFIRHVTTQKNHLNSLLNFNQPVRTSAFTFEPYSSKQPVASLLKIVTKKTEGMISPYDGASEALTIFGEEVTAAIKGMKSVDEALNSATKQIQASLEKYGVK